MVIDFADGLMDAVAAGRTKECQPPKMHQADDALALDGADEVLDARWHQVAID